jgi:hypothetical protein
MVSHAKTIRQMRGAAGRHSSFQAKGSRKVRRPLTLWTPFRILRTCPLWVFVFHLTQAASIFSPSVMSLAVGCLSTILGYEPSALRMRFENHGGRAISSIVAKLMSHEYVPCK